MEIITGRDPGDERPDAGEPALCSRVTGRHRCLLNAGHTGPCPVPVPGVPRLTISVPEGRELRLETRRAVEKLAGTLAYGMGVAQTCRRCKREPVVLATAPFCSWCADRILEEAAEELARPRLDGRLRVDAEPFLGKVAEASGSVGRLHLADEGPTLRDGDELRVEWSTELEGVPVFRSWRREVRSGWSRLDSDERREVLIVLAVMALVAFCLAVATARGGV